MPDRAAPDLEEPTGVLTLRRALSLALLRSPDLAALSLEVRARDAARLQAGLPPNPELEAEVEEVDVEGFGRRREVHGFAESETVLQLSQLIELGGKRGRRAELAAIERDLAGWDLESRRLDVLTEVTRAYVAVLAHQERLLVHRDILQLASRFEAAVSERVAIGKVSPVEGIKAETELSLARLELERTERDLEAARGELSALWASPSPVFERVQGDLEALGTIPRWEDLEARLDRNPDLARWPLEIAGRRLTLEHEKSMRIPDITLTAGTQYFADPSEVRVLFGISIPLPVFDRNQGGIEEAAVRIAQARESRRSGEVAARAALVRAYHALTSAHREASILRDEVLPRAARAAEATSQGYQEGKFGLLDVLDAQRTHFEAKLGHLEALASYHETVATVERLIAEEIHAVDRRDP